ncbi:hypothetical protein Tco_0288431 [Tanacetum coccineum]
MTRQETSNSNPLDVLGMVENNDELDTNGSSSIGAQNVDTIMESESEVEEVYNETASFMTSKSGGGTGRKSLYERWKNDYDDNPYDDEECEDLADEQLAFCDAFDKSLCGHVRC